MSVLTGVNLLHVEELCEKVEGITLIRTSSIRAWPSGISRGTFNQRYALRGENLDREYFEIMVSDRPACIVWTFEATPVQTVFFVRLDSRQNCTNAHSMNAKPKLTRVMKTHMASSSHSPGTPLSTVYHGGYPPMAPSVTYGMLRSRDEFMRVL